MPLALLAADSSVIDWGEVGERLWIEPSHAIAVVLSAVGIYLAFLMLVRLFGARVLTGMGTFDAVVVITLGAVAGRVILGDPPTLIAGVIGLTCLFAMEAAVGELHCEVVSPAELRRRRLELADRLRAQPAGERKVAVLEPLFLVETGGNGIGMHADASQLTFTEGFTSWHRDDDPRAQDGRK